MLMTPNIHSALYFWLMQTTLLTAPLQQAVMFVLRAAMSNSKVKLIPMSTACKVESSIMGYQH